MKKLVSYILIIRIMQRLMGLQELVKLSQQKHQLV